MVVPAKASYIDIDFRFKPHSAGDLAHMLTLTVFDPDGFRGAGHRGGACHKVCVGRVEATPGYIAGFLPAGEWIVQVDTHRIMPDEAVNYEMDVNIVEGENGDKEDASRSKKPVPAKPQRGAGWYWGDLHSHTHHSDAGNRTVAELVQTARDHGLDFIFLTDHNTTSGLDEMYALGTEDLLTAGGLELTTYWGHALCLGTREWVDWGVRPGTGEMERIATETYSKDQVFIIAHPQAIGDPHCTGCTWLFGDVMPGSAKLIEIWNEWQWDGNSNNEKALSIWYSWLNQGARLVATAGSDTHKAEDYATKPAFNVVYAEELSEAAILQALRAGHLYLSCGPKVLFEAQGESGQKWMMGDTVSGPARFRISWDDCEEGAQICLIGNGTPLKQWTAYADGEHEWNMEPGESDWVLVEIRDTKDRMLAVTNPLFLRNGSVSN
jgi:hypothetical protein